MSLRRAAIGLVAALLLGAGQALAGEGVLEINQAGALVGGITPADTPDFPVTLGLPGSYRLTGPLTVADPNLSAIEITSNDVTLDLNGFVVRGPITCTGSGSAVSCSGSGSGAGIVVLTREGIVVENGMVVGFASGGLLLFRVESCRLANLTVASNQGDGIRVGGSCEISGVIADANRGVGIFVLSNDPPGSDSPIDDIVARESVLSRNLGEGVFTTTSEGRDRFSLVRSTVWANGRTGLDLRTEGDVLDCSILANEGGGINLGVNSQNPDSGLVRGSAVRGNSYGFSFDPNYVGYSHNNFDANAGSSSGGVQIGPNVCGGDPLCP